MPVELPGNIVAPPGQDVVAHSVTVKSSGPYSSAFAAGLAAGTSGVTGAIFDTGGAFVSAQAPKYGVKADGNFLTVASITGGTAVLSSAQITAGMTNPPKIGQLISVIGAGAGAGILAVPLVTTILSVNLGAGTVTLNANAVNTVTASGPVFYASDDTTALASWITDCLAQGARGYLPDGYYGLNASLVLSSQLAVVGAGAREVWGSIAGGGNNAWFEGVAPYITGAVLWQFAAADGVLITAVGAAVELQDFGVMFANLYNGAGHGFNVAPSPLYLGKFDTGIVSTMWSNLKVYGHDGNHYGFVLNNPLLCTFIHLHSAGGGAMKLRGENANNYGNCAFINCYGLTISGGSADCLNMTADAALRLNLLTFERPQFSTYAPSPAIQGNTPVTGAQKMWNADVNSALWTTIGEDLETNVGSSNSRLGPGYYNLGSYGGGADFTIVGRATNNTTMAIYGVSGQTVNAFEIHPQRSFIGFAVDQRGHLIVGSNSGPTTSALNANISSLTRAGNDNAGSLAILVAAGGLAANTKIGTVTFNTTYGATAPFIHLANQTSGVGLAAVNFYCIQSTGVSFDLYSNQALVAGTYIAQYIVLGAA